MVRFGKSKRAEAVRCGGQVKGENKIFAEINGSSSVSPAVNCGELKRVTRKCKQQLRENLGALGQWKAATEGRGLSALWVRFSELLKATPWAGRGRHCPWWRGGGSGTCSAGPAQLADIWQGRGSRWRQVRLLGSQDEELPRQVEGPHSSHLPQHK